MVVADALSRKPLEPEIDDIELSEEVQVFVDSVRAAWPASPARLQEIRHATEGDSDLQDVMNFILNGWPRREEAVPPSLQPYYRSRSSLSITDGLLVYEDRILVPTALRPMILERLHGSHQGITKCRERAKLSVWWPTISKDMEKVVGDCPECPKNRPTQRNQPLQPSELPERPWAKLGTDLFEVQKKSYLVVIDYYSR